MAVRIAATWRVHPGRHEDFVKLASDWKPIGERFKMKGQQLYQVAAGNTEMPFNTMVFTAEFDRGADYGAWLDGSQADAGMQSWLSRALGKDAPAELVSTAILNQVQGF